MNLSGQSIAAVSDSVTRNGTKNTGIGWGYIVGGGVILIASGLGIRYYFNNKGNNSKHRNAKDLAQQKHENAMALYNRKSENRIKEVERKYELKKEFYDYKKAQTDTSANFDYTDDQVLSGEDASVASYDEIVSGKDVAVEDLRLGLRSFHIGEDCGLIGRTQIGKTTWVLQYSMSLARGYQEDDAKLTSDWKLSQPMTVLYFAFEQDRTYFKSKYGKFLKRLPNFFIELNTNPEDFKTIRRKIISMQNSIGSRRLLVVFDNITKMKNTGKGNRKGFFKWLDSYRLECASKDIPITYLKVYHTQGRYRDDIPLDSTTNYGIKTDLFFSQSLVGFGLCRGGDGRQRYIKELKNKLEPDGEKRNLSIYRFAGKEVPLYEYINEAVECDVLPSKVDLVRGSDSMEVGGQKVSQNPPKRGRREIYSPNELLTIHEEKGAGSSWREIFECRGWTFSKNKKRALQQALKRHGFVL